MKVTLASCRSPNPTTNADFVAATASIAVVLDGISVPPGVETGCVHGPLWYVRRLGTALLDALSMQTERPPKESLAQAVANVNAWHINACDLRLPSPSSAVAILCEQEETVEFLLLGDATVLLDEPTGVRVITDHLLEKAAGAGTGSRPCSKPRQPGGRVNGHGRQDIFWRVSSNPDAVDYALTGTVRRQDLRRAALLSDGAARLTDPFGLMDWPGFLDLLDKGGPESSSTDYEKSSDPILMGNAGRAARHTTTPRPSCADSGSYSASVGSLM